MQKLDIQSIDLKSINSSLSHLRERLQLRGYTKNTLEARFAHCPDSGAFINKCENRERFSFSNGDPRIPDSTSTFLCSKFKSIVE